MKFAFMSFSCPEPDFPGCLSLVRRLGYDGFEPRVAAKHGHGIELELSKEDRAARRSQAGEAGVALCCLATGCSFANPATVEAEKASAREYLQLAGDLGITRMRVFGGRMGEGLDRPRATELVASSLREVAPLASDLGVTLCVETHDDWCHPDDLAAVMELASHPAVGITWDMMHPVLFGGVTMEAAFLRLRPWIRHTHIHDGGTTRSPIEFKPCGEGFLDIPAFFRCLREINYDGFVSGEWIDCADTIDLASELARLRQLAAASDTPG